MSNVFKDLVEAIKDLAKKTKASGSDYTGQVTRVDGTTAYVQLDGADIVDTPVAMTINAVPGDKVRVRVNNGRAWLMGNDDAPPTDDRYARTVRRVLSGEIEETNGEVAAVKKTAQSANKIASNTNQYFWHTQEGTDTGAHITEIPQEEFLADPANGGGNLLARSNGIAVRDGLTELATFSQDGLYVYARSSNSGIEIAHLGYGEGVSDTSTSEAPYYTLGRRFLNSVIGAYSAVFGKSNTASRGCAVAMGDGVEASGYASTAMGNMTKASGHQSLAIGVSSEASGDASVATGGHTKSKGYASTTMGWHTVATEEYNVVIGKFNKATVSGAYPYTYSGVGDYPLIIGNGTDDTTAARSNALTVDWSGNLNISGEIKGPNVLTRTSKSADAVSVPSGTWTALCTFTGKANTTYMILYGAAFASNANGLRQLHFAANSGTSGRYSPSYAAANGDQTRMQGAIIYTFTGAGTISLWARQTSGSALTTYGWYEAIKLPN